MLKRYTTLVILLFSGISWLQSQAVSIDSVLNIDNDITLVYTISDNLPGFAYQIDAVGIFGADTVSLSDARGFPQDSLTAGTYRMRWDAVSHLGRFRGKARFLIAARPGFRLTKAPENSYKIGKEIKLAWYGGQVEDDQLTLQLMQEGEVVTEEQLQFGVLATTYQLPEDLKPGEGYLFRLTGLDSGIAWETKPFSVTKIKERKWYIYAIPAGIVAGLLTYLILDGPIDPPEDLPIVD